MDAAQGNALAASICPKCGLGELTKHCEPDNRCAWWVCEFGCGYGVDLARGSATGYLNLPGSPSGVDSDRGKDGDEGEGLAE
jgi:hypothetical protein